jgi:hypothetical protein
MGASTLDKASALPRGVRVHALRCLGCTVYVRVRVERNVGRFDDFSKIRVTASRHMFHDAELAELRAEPAELAAKRAVTVAAEEAAEEAAAEGTSVEVTAARKTVAAAQLAHAAAVSDAAKATAACAENARATAAKI